MDPPADASVWALRYCAENKIDEMEGTKVVQMDALDSSQTVELGRGSCALPAFISSDKRLSRKQLSLDTFTMGQLHITPVPISSNLVWALVILKN